jgi:lysophospholipase L1-like esterase
MLKRIFELAAITLTVASAGAQTNAKVDWVGSWAASPMGAQGGWSVKLFSNATLREIMHISNGGSEVRVRFTNAYGSDPLALSDAHVAVSAGDGAIQAGTDHALTFGGASGVRIPPGAELYSDPVEMTVAPLADLAISFYVPAQIMRSETYHDFADQDNFMVDGNLTAAPNMTAPTKFQSWYFLDGVDVRAKEGSRAIIALGDSITDGAKSTPNANHRWPDILAARLKQEHGLENVAVLNQGIGGNRVLNDFIGPSALARLDRDVLAQDGARYVIVLEGINDIGRFLHAQGPEDDFTPQQMELAYTEIVEAAHEHGMKAYGATLTPYGGAFYFSEKGEQVREAVNQWILTGGVFDGVIDFDAITRDPESPNRFNPAFDSGDHLHPNDAGYKAMADGIDLKLFR